MKNFYNRIHIANTIIQFSTEKVVLATSKDIDLDKFISENQDKNLFFLAGVNPDVGMARAKNNDVKQRRYIVLDFDIRSDMKEIGEITNEEIKAEGFRIGKELSRHDALKDWSYLIFTGNGIHVYYIGNPTLCDDFFIEGVQKIYNKVEKLVGFAPDSACKNSARILRMPNSYNNKKDKKKVEVLVEQERVSDLLDKVRDIGEQSITKAKQDAQLKNIKFSLQSDSSVYEAINQIPIGQLVAKHFGWTFDGRNFYENGKQKSKACYVPSKENFVVHGGTDHFSNKNAGYTPFCFIQEVLGLDVKDVFAWFKENFQEIADVDEKARKKFKEENVVVLEEKTSNDKNSFTWGLEDIDEKILTPKRGKFYIMVSDENQGKSTFCFFMARQNYRKYGHKVVYFNLEQTKEEVIDNMAIQYVSPTHIEFRDEKYKQNPLYHKRKKELEDQDDIVFLGSSAEKLTDIAFIEETIARQDKIDFLLLDNLTCITVDGKDRNEQIKQISLKIIQMAKKLNIPIILVHHYKKLQTKIKGNFRDVHEMEGAGALKNLANTVIQVARNKDPIGQDEYKEFYIKEGKIRLDIHGKGTVCVFHEKGEFIPSYIL